MKLSIGTGHAGMTSSASSIVDAVLYRARANQVTGEIIHVDGGSHAGH